jgi:RimJ/RimL family protein N-acetyltransferase
MPRHCSLSMAILKPCSISARICRPPLPKRTWVQTKIELFDRDDQLSLWTVIHTESGQIVGDVGLQHEDYGAGPVVGLGGRGNRQFWRQGLGFEAANATIAAGFEQLDLPAIGAETRPENLPAQALLSKLGLRQAGTNTQGWPVYMITREDWLARRPESSSPRFRRRAV